MPRKLFLVPRRKTSVCPEGERTGAPMFWCLWQQARPCAMHLLGIFLLSLLATPLAMLQPVPIMVAVDSVIGGRPLPWLLHGLPAWTHTSWWATLVLAASLLLLITLLANLHALASWLLQTYTGEKLVLDFRAALFAHVQRLSLLFYDRRLANDVTYRIQHDASFIQYIFIQGLIPFISSALSFVAMAYVIARIDHYLAIIALALSPFLFLLARTSGRKVRTGWHQVKELDSSAMSVLQEALSAVRVVKAFGQEEHEDARFLDRSSRRMRGQVRLAMVQAAFHGLIGLTIALGSATALLVGIAHVHSGVLTLGNFFVVMAYMAGLYEPLRSISSKIPEFQSWLVSAERAFALLNERPEVRNRPNARPLARAQGAIEFRDVRFEYIKDRPVLHDVSFAVAPGTRVGLLGPTGSGKSTLVGLLARFYDPEQGVVLLDGTDVRDYRIADLRRQFAFVLQEPVLFSTTIAENIAYGRPAASQREIVEAAKAAGAHDFISHLPLGYDTELGERGARLSGGERQRISLARAFLKDAPILILDEPTSSVDVITEAGIMEATQQLMRGRTSFMIAHRLSTLQSCDLLLVLEDGRLTTTTRNLAEAMQHLRPVASTPVIELLPGLAPEPAPAL